MSGRRVLLYFAWSRPGETHLPYSIIDDRFPALFELRRLFYPKFESLSDPAQVDQGIAGFLDHIQKPNFQAFAQCAETLTGYPAVQVERVGDDGRQTLLDNRLVTAMDTMVIVSFDSLRTDQRPSNAELRVVRRFLDDPDHVLFVCPHHDIGETPDVSGQIAEHLHHGDHGIPPRQGFGGFARALLAELGVPIENRFGLRPALEPSGEPSPIEIDGVLDDLRLLDGVASFNSHRHLPHLERIGDAISRMDVLARQRIDTTAPPHPFTLDGRASFDALLQSRSGTFPGRLLVCDTTLFSSTAGGVDNLDRLWRNLLARPRKK